MKGYGLLLRRTWVLPVVVIALVVGHAIALHYLSSHAALPAAVVSGVVLLVVIKHLGLLGSLYAFLRRRFRSNGR